MPETQAIKTPAHRLIAQCGVHRLAEWTGRHPNRIYAWKWPPARNGTGGLVPPRLRPKIMAGAWRDLALVLLPADFEPHAGEAFLFEEAQA